MRLALSLPSTIALLLAAASAAAQTVPVTSFSIAWFDSTEPVDKRTLQVQTGGGAASVARSGTTFEGGYRQSNYAGSASADLATGSLKMSTGLTVAPHWYTYTGGPGQLQSNVYSVAMFGDGFRSTQQDGSPFDWTGETAHFSIGLTGERVESGLNIAQVFPYSTPGTSLDAIKSFLRFTAYTPGTLDLVYQLNTFDITRPFSEFVALNTQVVANTLYASPCTAVTDPGWGDSAACAVKALPGELAVSFNPGGDFDWVVQLDTSIYIDWASTTASALLDLSHTAVVAFDAPAGAVTYAASGRFPGTLPASPVPEPGSATLFALGAAVLGLLGRRRLPARGSARGGPLLAVLGR